MSLFVFLAVLIGNTAPTALAGAPLYPDIITLPPSGLYIERNSAGHYLVRFANTAANLGGRLEISVDSIGSKAIYQSVYDQMVGGTRVIKQQVNSDLIYHPQHNHFHFAGFARSELLRKDSAGYYKVTNRQGSKTSFCILDTVRVNGTGPTFPTYNSCGATFQGMSAGWGDTYVAALFDQWIDVGTAALADGQYAIRSTVDPDNRLMESNDFNNIGITYFTVANGRIVGLNSPPLCTVQQAAGSVGTVDTPAATVVGQTVRLACTKFSAGEVVDIYWGSVNTSAKAIVTATSTGSLTSFVQIPPSSLGVHYWIAKGRTSGVQAAAIVNTIPSVVLTPDRGEISSKTTAVLRGFSAGETVQIKFYKAGTVVASTMLVDTSSSGSGEISFPIPAVPFGAHKVEAIGQDSGAMATSSFVTSPSIELTEDQAESGDQVGVFLRGFAASETVKITLGPEKIELVEFVASHSGSTSASTAKFTVPDVATGTWTLYATGSISGVPASVELDVDSSGSAGDPTVTPTNTPEPTSTESAPTETPTSTSTATATETPVNATPVAVAGDDQSVTDSENSGSESIQLTSTGSYDPELGALTYSWSIDDQVIASEPDPLVELSIGEYVITLTVTDALGAFGSDQVQVNVEPPELPTATPTETPTV